jgi:hypothetical protein
MSRLFFFLRVLAGWMVLSGGGWCLGEDWEKEAFVLAPEVEEAWGKRMEEARPLRVKRDTEKVMVVVEELREEYGLDEQVIGELKEVVPGVVDEGLKYWERFLRKRYRPSLQGEAEEGLKVLRRLSGDVAKFFSSHVVTFYQRPEEMEGFVAGVRQALGGEKFEKWNRRRLSVAEERRKKAAVWVEAGVRERDPAKLYAEGFKETLDEMCSFMDEKAEGYHSMVKQVEKWSEEYVLACRQWSMLTLDSWTTEGPGWGKAEKSGSFLSLPPRTWTQMAQRSQLLAMMPAEAKVAHERLVKEREEWMKGVVVRARVMIVEQMVALDAGQLKAVRALAEALPIEAGEPLLNPESDPEHWKVWKGAEGARRLNEILDDRQERMVAKGVARFEKGNSGMNSPQEVGQEVLRHPALGAEEPEAVEELVSEYLAEDSQEHAMKGFDSIMRDVDAVVRVLGLDDGVRAELELGAKGTVQAAAEAYRVNQGRWVRSQTQGATTATIRNRLKNMGGYTFHFGNEGNTPVEEVLNEVIDDKQKEVVLAYQDAVRKRRDEAIAEVALGRLQKALGLNTEQRERLGKALVGVMGRYGPDIEMNFRSWGERMPWFLQSYYLMMPGAGVEEGELKRLLNERQREIWDEQVTERGGHYWGQILEYHEQRVKSKGERLANRRILFQQ